jgi:hypothetical protein
LSALFFLNSPFAVDRAKAFAERVRKSAGDKREKQAEVAFRLALGRAPATDEQKVIASYFDKAQSDTDSLVWLCQVIMAMNEFTTIE